MIVYSILHYCCIVFWWYYDSCSINYIGLLCIKESVQNSPLFCHKILKCVYVSPLRGRKHLTLLGDPKYTKQKHRHDSNMCRSLFFPIYWFKVKILLKNGHFFRPVVFLHALGCIFIPKFKKLSQSLDIACNPS